ncbi:MAG: helix-turn-helix domain containing protein [Pelosinus sp.]|nr:helix-turn-helix domain containing protein [Pelosinus sp.]
MTTIERIVNILDDRGISQKDLCDKTGIKPQTFSTWKKQFSDVPSDKLIAIANFLKVSISFLLTGEGSPEIKQLSDQEEELLRIYNLLNLKDKTALLSRAYELEEQNK